MLLLVHEPELIIMILIIGVKVYIMCVCTRTYVVLSLIRHDESDMRNFPLVQVVIVMLTINHYATYAQARNMTSSFMLEFYRTYTCTIVWLIIPVAGCSLSCKDEPPTLVHSIDS